LAVPNNLEILSDARTGQEIFVTCGQTFVDQSISRKAEIVSALQGLNSSGADSGSCLAEVLCDRLSYGSCQADYDVWFRLAQGPSCGKYYKYVIAYTDNILRLSCIPTVVWTNTVCSSQPSKDVSGGSHRLVQVW
jgi:hypothetical protein